MKFLLAILLAVTAPITAFADNWDTHQYRDEFGRTVIHHDTFTIIQVCVAGTMFAVFKGLGDSMSATMILQPNGGGTIYCDDKAEYLIESRREESEKQKKNYPPYVLG